MQISHAARQTPGELNLYPLAPSSIPLKIPGRKFGVPTEMTEEEIIDVINRFIFVGKVARESGFTGIQLHSAHGYLLSEFLSPDINIRSDSCLLYTSDAADEEDSVDLGGRRIIKKMG